MLSQKKTLLVASGLGFLAVALGAFGAHALKPLLTEGGRTDTFELAVRYHFYHTLAMLGVAILMNKFRISTLKISALLFLIGIILFSGSLYALCLLGNTTFAMITPVGGVFLLGGWVAMFVAILKTNKTH